jgi:hypothetical protein
LHSSSGKNYAQHPHPIPPLPVSFTTWQNEQTQNCWPKDPRTHQCMPHLQEIAHHWAY